MGITGLQQFILFFVEGGVIILMYASVLKKQQQLGYSKVLIIALFCICVK